MVDICIEIPQKLHKHMNINFVVVVIVIAAYA